MAAVVEFSAVSVRRGDRLLLDDVTWTVLEGERWAVMGPNGAGKTTLLQIAAARLHPTAGRVHILEQELGAVDLAELRPALGWTAAPLAATFPAGETVRDVVLTGAWAVTGRWREQYVASDEQRALELLERWGLAGMAQRTFGTLSEGERKRALIARSLMGDPELLLLDEPAAGLDLGGRELLVQALGEWALDATAPATILVTHHLEEVPTGFTHGLLLLDGRVVAAGPLDDVLTDDQVSHAFGIALHVEHRDGRWSARSRGMSAGAANGAN